MQLEILHLHSHRRHFLGETHPVARIAHDILGCNAGAVSLLADQQPFENQAVDGLPKCVSRNVQVLGQFHLIGKKLPVAVLFFLNHPSQYLLGLLVQGF